MSCNLRWHYCKLALLTEYNTKLRVESKKLMDSIHVDRVGWSDCVDKVR